MKSAAWIFHRLRAMSGGEMLAHLRKRIRQRRDASATFDWTGPNLETRPLFPQLPDRNKAPAEVKDFVREDARKILAGRWRAFGHLEIQVDDPPAWHMDYLAGKNFVTDRIAFRLNHRALAGADIKLIWELSRWSQLVRVAQWAWLDGNGEATRKCLRWLQDWRQHNPPFRGWNWTSALETGMRLIQFTWLDALLAEGAEGLESMAELEKLRATILPAHVHYTWHYRSVGSSANNHLLGELAGLILAVVRWPSLAQFAVDLEKLHRLWEREVLAQFSPDGGNREQALNYHLFSWELCWQTREALEAAGLVVSREVHERLAAARQFFLAVQTSDEPWDYGDSDNAYVTPVAGREGNTTQEWWRWLANPSESPSIDFWWKHSRHRPDKASIAAENYFPDSGIFAQRDGAGWFLRWDLSPLGYGTTSAHGHLDALHLSLWYRGVAIVIDPGTGAYYAEPELRNYLASRAAHNGPSPLGTDYPKRLGPFLWGEHHDRPSFHRAPEGMMIAEMHWSDCRIQRRVRPVVTGHGFEIEDTCDSPTGFAVHWQFAPGSVLQRLEDKRICVTRKGVSVLVHFDVPLGAMEVVAMGPPSETNDRRGTVSPGFRAATWAPYVQLRAKGGEKPCVFRTSFLASDPS